MLKYRSIFQIEAPDAYMRSIEPAVYRWLETKNYDPSQLSASWTDLGNGARATLVSVSGSSRYGARTRVRLLEPSGWNSTITIDTIARNAARFWIDIESEDRDTPAGVPNVVRDLVSQTTARDGAARISDAPFLIQTTDIGDLELAINDANRRGVIFVAGTSSELPIDKWRDYVERITHDTVGLASVAVLDARATSEFERRHRGTGMSVPPGAIRSFMPGTRLSDESDARRNRILGLKRLVEDSPRFLAKILAYAAREATLQQPLEADLRRIDRVLSRAQVEDLLGLERGRETARPRTDIRSPAPPSVLADRRETRRLDAETLDSVAMELGVTALTAKQVLSTVVGMLRSTWGTEAIDEAVLRSLADVLAEPPNVRSERLTQVSATLEDLRDQLATVEEESRGVADAATRKYEDLDLEYASALEASRRKDATIAHLRRVLERADLGAEAWDDSEVRASLRAPTSFIEVAECAAQLVFIRFTANEESLVELDTAGTAMARSGKVWDGLLALNDYADSKAQGDFSGSFQEYVQTTPAGYLPFSANAYAARESETVQRSPKLRDKRRFPVPVEIDSSGSALMFSHLKFGKATTDARVYFLDATASAGYIVVGYIGRHLPVKSSN